MNPLERIVPHSIEAEQGILGCIMLDPNCIHECFEKLKLPDVFYDLRHHELFNTLVKLVEENIPIDPITVQQRLRDKKQLEAIGGTAYLSAIMDSVPSVAHLTYYIDLIKEKYVLRRTIQTCTLAIQAAYEWDGSNIDELTDKLETDVMAISETRSDAKERDIKTIVRNVIDHIEILHQSQGKTVGITTGFIDLDRIMRGLKSGVTILAARPSAGKTSLAMNIAEYLSLECDTQVAVFSLEMTDTALVQRMMFSRARVNGRALENGTMVERDFPKLTGAAVKIANSKLHIIEAASISLLQLKAKARRLYQQHGIKLIIIDYLQLIETARRPGENREQQVAAISRGVKQLSIALHVPIILLSQLNRDLEKDRARKPRLSDLRESGSIEQDADNVWLLYKPVFEGDEDKEESDVENIRLIVAKQRNGPLGEVDLTFFKNYTRFESASGSQYDLRVLRNDCL